MAKHVLTEGESLVSLAKQYGFGTWQTIFNDGANANLKSKRGHANSLLAGDIVVIPERKPKTLPLAINQKHKIVVAVARGVWNLKWGRATASCGDKVTLSGETTLPDGDLALALKPREVESPKLPPKITVKVKDRKFRFDWTVKDVQHLKAGSPAKAFPVIHLDATMSDADVPCNVATLAVKAVSDVEKQTFDANRSWSGFSNHSHFEQRIEAFTNVVDVALSVLKGWGGTHVDLRAAGITGTAAGCPWPGHRWAAERHVDGPRRVPRRQELGAVAEGFVPGATNYQAVGFYTSGTSFVGASGGTWPERAALDAIASSCSDTSAREALERLRPSSVAAFAATRR